MLLLLVLLRFDASHIQYTQTLWSTSRLYKRLILRSMSWRSIVARQQQKQREKRKDRQKVQRARAFIALPTNTNTALVRCRRATSTFTPLSAGLSPILSQLEACTHIPLTNITKQQQRRRRQSATALAATIGYTQTQQQRSCAPNGNEKARDNGKNLRSAVTYPIKRTRERALEELFCICPAAACTRASAQSEPIASSAMRCARDGSMLHSRRCSRYI
ncbi:unnamed protein product [Trichogramma brassicae]|uniref:Secreted protein n=1 Tax=Trichogramma brassicae TaxID=86971 RepID=A0A6H5J844_9HYME|nr:unnamed protein product [Trichogramma brassicae]